MKRYTMIASMLMLPLLLIAQTEVTTYVPGVSAEGAVYYLPMTSLSITLTTEKTVYTPGEFCKYAERYLRLNNVSDKAEKYFTLTNVEVTPSPVPDTKKIYHIQFTDKSIAPLIELNNDGIILSINTHNTLQTATQKVQPTETKQRPNAQSYLTEEMLQAGSKAKMAELIAKEIYLIRESKNSLLRGQADNMPKDGEALQIILNNLQDQEQAFTEMFTGTTTKEVQTHHIELLPTENLSRLVLARFSRKLGLLDSENLAGSPLYIDVKNLNTVPEISDNESASNKKKKLLQKKSDEKKQEGVVYNLPSKASVKIFTNNKVYYEDKLSFAQFGNTETLSSALFNKKNNTKVTFEPTTGAILKVEKI